MYNINNIWYVRYINNNGPYIAVIVRLFINAGFGIDNDNSGNDFWRVIARRK